MVAVIINTTVTFATFIIVFVTGIAITWPDVPWVPVGIVTIALNAVIPILFYPISKTLWMALELGWHPWRRTRSKRPREPGTSALRQAQAFCGLRTVDCGLRITTSWPPRPASPRWLPTDGGDPDVPIDPFARGFRYETHPTVELDASRRAPDSPSRRRKPSPPILPSPRPPPVPPATPPGRSAPVRRRSPPGASPTAAGLPVCPTMRFQKRDGS